LGETGVIVPAKSPEGLAQAMLGLMRQPSSVRQALGRAARERIVERFSMDARASEWEDVYRRLLPGS
jgi:glycosyltransferase involved in cell wall biosynthesis